MKRMQSSRRARKPSVVVSLGKDVSEWKEGQRVVADPGINTVDDEFTRRGEHSMSPGYFILGEQVRGGLAEYVAVPASNLVAIPDGIEFPTAAAPLLVTLTAWRMLIHRAKLSAGESVLVVGAGGGVNSMAMQVSKLAGATVYVVASNAEKAEKAKSFEIADFFSRLEAARLMVYKACWTRDQGKEFRLEASMAKYLTVEIARELGIWASDLFGASSVIFDHPVHKFPLDAWASSLGEGTQDVQKLVIFREIMKRLGS